MSWLNDEDWVGPRDGPDPVQNVKKISRPAGNRKIHRSYSTTVVTKPTELPHLSLL